MIIEINSGWRPQKPKDCLDNINKQIDKLKEDNIVRVITLEKKDTSHLEFIYTAFLEVIKKNDKQFI